jgi:hypothetical protein
MPPHWKVGTSPVLDQTTTTVITAAEAMTELNPLVAVRRVDGHGILILHCPNCGRRDHLQGDGGDAGPDYGHRLAHCILDDLPPTPRGKSLGDFLRLDHHHTTASHQADAIRRDRIASAIRSR